jgi:phage gp37-like protein
MFYGIETAMIARIKNSALGAYIKKLDTRDKADVDLAKGIINSTVLPAVYLGFLGGDATRVAQSYRQTARWSLYVMTSSLYSSQVAKEKPVVGAYAILKGLQTLFTNHTLGLAITPLVLGGVEPVALDDEFRTLGMVCYSVTFATSFIVEAANADGSGRGAATEDEIEKALVEIIAKYAFEPGANFTAPVATDTLKP